MQASISLAGLGFGLIGAILFALGDAWLSRSILVYLDAIEADFAKLVEAVRTGDTQLKVTGINLKRDHGQNSARALKTFGWSILVLGFALQIVARYWTRLAGVS